MSNHATYKNPAVLSHHAMRRMVGVIALLLPFVLVGGTILLSLLGPSHGAAPPAPPAIDQRLSLHVDEGLLCGRPVRDRCVPHVLAGIRLDRRDHRVSGRISYSGCRALPLSQSARPNVYSALQLELNTVHTVFAAQLFLVLAYFCLVLFRKTAPGKTLTLPEAA